MTGQDDTGEARAARRRAVGTALTISALAGAQHGFATRDQLRQAGVSDDTIDTRLRQRHLRRLHRGVYLIGPVLPPNARQMAAVLACGPNAG